MLDLNKNYEVVVFGVGETKAGAKMGKLQVKDENGDLLNCVLWEETLNRLDEKIFRTGNIVKITSGTFNPQYNNCHVSALSLIKEAKLGLNEQEKAEIANQMAIEQQRYFDDAVSDAQKAVDEAVANGEDAQEAIEIIAKQYDLDANEIAKEIKM